ncbi:MAG: class III extradiol ring-cleavage dioxygenase [Proteobacteria bacterium]|nr:class III extradiol ring-cleavage dioxygenase [Pseudomonadota bacterium]
MITRREMIITTTAVLVARPLLAASVAMPSLFFGHGGPPLAKDKVRGQELFTMANELPARPSGIIAFTPRVRARRITIASSGIARWSFPRRFQKTVGDLRYHSPRADSLAQSIFQILDRSRFAYSKTEHAGFNHTVWMGLRHMFPDADIPVVEIAMPFESATRLFELGQALAPLRESGVLVLSSGTVTHNLGSFGQFEQPSAWAKDYDERTAATIANNDIDSLIDWRNKGPEANIAHPDDGGHFNVMMLALGAAIGSNTGLSRSRAMHDHFEMGTFSRRGFIFS